MRHQLEVRKSQKSMVSRPGLRAMDHLSLPHMEVDRVWIKLILKAHFIQ